MRQIAKSEVQEAELPRVLRGDDLPGGRDDSCVRRKRDRVPQVHAWIDVHQRRLSLDVALHGGDLPERLLPEWNLQGGHAGQRLWNWWRGLRGLLRRQDLPGETLPGGRRVLGGELSQWLLPEWNLQAGHAVRCLRNGRRGLCGLFRDHPVLRGGRVRPPCLGLPDADGNRGAGIGRR